VPRFGYCYPSVSKPLEQVMPTYHVVNAGGTTVLCFEHKGSYVDTLVEAKRPILRSAASPATSGTQRFSLMLATELLAEIEIRIEGVLAPWARRDASA
jgi:hypothetical protein